MRGWKLAIFFVYDKQGEIRVHEIVESEICLFMPQNKALNLWLVKKSPAANLKAYHTIYLPCRHPTSRKV